MEILWKTLSLLFMYRILPITCKRSTKKGKFKYLANYIRVHKMSRHCFITFCLYTAKIQQLRRSNFVLCIDKQCTFLLQCSCSAFIRYVTTLLDSQLLGKKGEENKDLKAGFLDHHSFLRKAASYTIYHWIVCKSSSANSYYIPDVKLYSQIHGMNYWVS